MIDGRRFIPKDSGEKLFDTDEEFEAYDNKMTKQEILERMGKAIEYLARFYEFANEEDINSFLYHAFGCCLEASLQIKIIKDKYNYEGAFKK